MAKQLTRSDFAGPDAKRENPARGKCGREKTNGNSTSTSRDDRRRSHRVSAALELSTKKFTEFSSPQKTRAAPRKIPRIFFRTPSLCGCAREQARNARFDARRNPLPISFRVVEIVKPGRHEDEDQPRMTQIRADVPVHLVRIYPRSSATSAVLFVLTTAFPWKRELPPAGDRRRPPRAERAPWI